MSTHFFTAGWSYDDWVGYFYPQKASKSFNYLVYLSQFMDGTEVNSSFYAVPRRDYVRRWLETTPPEFFFSFKLLQSLTHGYPEEATPEEIDYFRRAVEPALASGRLACLLMQFPVFFHANPGNIARVERIRSLFPEYPLVIEVRHESWETTMMLQWAHSLDLGWCNVDMPQRGGGHIETEHVTSAKIAYVRLHGRRSDVFYTPVDKKKSKAEQDAQVVEKYNYLYTADELKPWAERIARLGKKSEKVIVVANNHFRGKAPANALMLKAMVEQRKVEVPETLGKAYPEVPFD